MNLQTLIPRLLRHPVFIFITILLAKQLDKNSVHFFQKSYFLLKQFFRKVDFLIPRAMPLPGSSASLIKNV